MKKLCVSCKADLSNGVVPKALDFPVSRGICKTCSKNIFNEQDKSIRKFLDLLEGPILLLEPEPRRVFMANAQACSLFGKDISQIERHKGGEVFDCIYAFTEEGCGKHSKCENCSIRRSIVETMATGKSFPCVMANLEVRRNAATVLYTLQVSTERIDKYALVRIDSYKKLEQQV